MRGATLEIPAFNTLSIPIRPRKSKRLSEEETPAVKDGYQNIPSATDAADMQRADDASARGSVSGESNKPKGPGDASRAKGKGKVDPVDKKAEKKRIVAKAKADLEVGRIPAFRIGGTCEVLPSEIINSGSGIAGAYEAVVAEKEEQIKSLLARTDVDAARTELDCQKARAHSWLVSANANRQSADDSAQVEVLKGEKQRLEEEVKKRDVHLEAVSAKIAELRASLEKSRHTEDRLRKERTEHAADLMRSLAKMVEAEYELPPGLLENYAKEEKEYLAKVESFDIDSLGDDILFPTPPPPPPGPPRDVASQVPEGISDHGSFLSPQDNQDGDQV
ncbi:hypothetical protein AALP_AA6G092000 [Arabis alpina]|uniref:Uncharacterized protein n=1 Tax=Arabis alpina TaxID=50452 RepID=A0A087GN27_ARAAL|nr:hypothetical protein AALP_AA6G092000 [Arabis alpina]